MNTLVQLFIHEVLAVFFEVFSYLHDQTRKRRVSIDSSSVFVVINIANISFSILSSNINSDYLKTLYTCPSERVKVILDHKLEIYSLMNNDSELNMMLLRVFERLNLLIDTNIHWKIDKYDFKTNVELDEYGFIDVYHEISMNIDDVEVKTSIFVVKYCNNDLILGRSWKRLIKAEFINEDNDLYTTRIKNSNGSKMVQFCVVKIEHERNREFARSVEIRSLEIPSLKV